MLRWMCIIYQTAVSFVFLLYCESQIQSRAGAAPAGESATEAAAAAAATDVTSVNSVPSTDADVIHSCYDPHFQDSKFFFTQADSIVDYPKTPQCAGCDVHVSKAKQKRGAGGGANARFRAVTTQWENKNLYSNPLQLHSGCV